MIEIKSFFRAKSTKIYLSLFTIMLLIISILFNIRDYYKTIITKSYQDNSYYTIVMNKDNNYISKIESNKNITDIKETLIIPISEIDIKEENIINILVDNYTSSITIKEDTTNELKDNESYIEAYNYAFNNNKEIHELKNIKLRNNNLYIKGIKETKYTDIVVSNNIYQKLKEENDYISYTFILKDYNKKQETEKELNSIKDIEYYYSELFESSDKLNTLNKLKQIINIIEKVCILLITIFIFLFIIIVYSIISDNINKMYIERMLGFSKKQIKKYLIYKVILLCLLSIIIYIFIYKIISILINNILSMNLIKFNSNIIYISLILIIISILLCLIKKFNIKK